MKSPQIASLAAILGIGLIGLSFAWPSFTSGPKNWSDEKARELVEVRTALHGLSHEHGGGENHSAGAPADKAGLENRRRQLESELETAQSGGATVARVLWIAGALLAAVGAGVYFAGREN